MKKGYNDFTKCHYSEYLDPINLNLPRPKNWKAPVLVIVYPDNTAVQLLTEEMLSDYWRDKVVTDSSIVCLGEPTLHSTGIMILQENKQVEHVSLITKSLPSVFRERPKS